jgi:hypothetical protein
MKISHGDGSYKSFYGFATFLLSDFTGRPVVIFLIFGMMCQV